MTNNQQPTTNNQQPTTNNQQPTTNNQQPTTNNQQPTTNSDTGRLMHPPRDGSIFIDLVNLLLDKDDRVLTLFVENNLFNEKSLPFWLNEINNLNDEIKADVLTSIASRLEQFKNHGIISRKSPLIIIKNLLDIYPYTNSNLFDNARISNNIAVDFGSGVNQSLDASLILYANGFKRTISYEPFEINIDRVEHSVFLLIQDVIKNPENYTYTNTTKSILIQRLTSLDLTNLKQKLSLVNKGINKYLDLGGVVFTNSKEAIINNNQKLDLIYSNSVLEHISDMKSELSWQKDILNEDGVCCHTVDFTDHRVYFKQTKNLFLKYFDGILKDINGLTPLQMEFLMLSSGFKVIKYNKLNAPENYLDGYENTMIEHYKKFDKKELLQRVNAYVLSK